MKTRGALKQSASSRIIERGGRWRLEIYFTAGGKRTLSRTNYKTERGAQKAELGALKRLENGLPPFAAAVRAAVTVAEVLEFYGRSRVGEAQPRSIERMAEHVARLNALMGGEAAEGLTFDRLLRYKRERTEDHKRRTGRALSAVTVKKECSHLRAALNYGREHDLIAGHVFERLSTAKRREIFVAEDNAGTVITDDTFEQLVGLVPSWGGGALRLARLCGMRKGEVCGLTWADIDFVNGAINIRVSKTGPRSLPLTAEMKALLPPVSVNRDGFVFGMPGTGGRESIYGALGQAWQRARKKLKLPGLRLHDLRHSAATEMAQAVGLTEMGVALGMSPGGAAHYGLHNAKERQAAAFAAVAARRATLHKRLTSATASVESGE